MKLRKKLIHRISPPLAWRVPVIILLGILAGIGVLTLHFSRAPSYLSNKPETCINCHIMVPGYATWAHSAHRETANCNDCHVPHNNLLNHYYFKAKDGIRHATIFTLRAEPQVIEIKSAGAKVVQDNCIRCHGDKIFDSHLMRPEFTSNQLRGERQCWECHRETPHGLVKGLAATPHAIVPMPGSPVPEWITRMIERE